MQAKLPLTINTVNHNGMKSTITALKMQFVYVCKDTHSAKLCVPIHTDTKLTLTLNSECDG